MNSIVEKNKRQRDYGVAKRETMVFRKKGSFGTNVGQGCGFNATAKELNIKKGENRGDLNGQNRR